MPSPLAPWRVFLLLASTFTTLRAAEPLKPGNAPGALPLKPEEERASFTVPEGYTVELVAAESEGIGKFVPLAFDAQGRLWTTTAFEYPVDGNENPGAADALYASRAKDKVLVFDTPFAPGPQTPRVFAEGLAIPLGVLPYGDGCYVQHGHDIALLHDTDGDGKADKREVILTGFGVQDSHLFPHQFMRAPGGWIWMAQGAFNYSKVRKPDEPAEKAVQFDQTRMAKFRPDGSEFTITSNGPCNIWGLVLNGEGEAFIQEANDFGYPVMPFHEYANYPGCSNAQWKSYAPEFPGTPGIPMGGTGLSGLALTDKGGPFTEPWREVMLVANPITNRINAIKMHRDGPRWKLEKLPDFLVSSDSWFRPVAITVGPDGCLYIVDWYNKIISHNEVPRNHPDRDKTRGRIWRVKPTGTVPFVVPDFTKLNGEELLAKLGGPSLAQSHLAWQAIGDRKLVELIPRLREMVQGVVVAQASRLPEGAQDAQASRGGLVSHLPVDPSSVDHPNQAARELATGDPGVPGRMPGTAGETPALPEATRIAALWALRGLGEAETKISGEGLFGGSTGKSRNVRREALNVVADLHLWSWSLAGARFDPDPEVRAAYIGRLGEALAKSDSLPFTESDLQAYSRAGRVDDVSRARKKYQQRLIESLVQMALEPLSTPVAPSTQNGRPIKVLEAYDREFERYLVRAILEAHQAKVAEFLEERVPTDSASEVGQSNDSLPLEGELVATLALEPRASAARVARLLPKLPRSPGSEEILRLAQFPNEPGVAEAWQTLLQSPALGTSVLETLLAGRAKFDAAKLAPTLSAAATKLLENPAPESLSLGFRLVTGFHLAALEEPLVALLKQPDPLTSPAAAVGALQALTEIGSGESALYVRLASSSPHPDIRHAALEALTASRAAEAPTQVLELLAQQTPSVRHAALERLSANERGASAILAALTAGTLAKSEVDTNLLDRMQAALGPNNSPLAHLVDSLGALFRPVLALDGSEEAWTQTDITLEGPCTIEAWVKLDPQGRPISNADGIGGAPDQLDLNFAAGRFRVYTFAGGDVVTAKKPLMPGLWTHVAATRSAEGIWKLYIDGELDAAATKAAPGKIENYRIGWTTAKGGTWGALSELRLWNREKSALEILAEADRSIPVGPPISGAKEGQGNFSSPNVGLLFASGDGAWGGAQHGAVVRKTSDFPPVLTPDEATALDAQYTKYRALANAPGDPARGRQVAQLCQACHLMGPSGGNIGPNLSGVGAMGTEGILRNVLQPNAAMENGYRIYRVELKNGDLLDALFVSENAEAVVVRQPGAEDRRMAKSDIRSSKYLRRSLMPEGLLETMTPEGVSDLFAYLRTLR